MPTNANVQNGEISNESVIQSYNKTLTRIINKLINNIEIDNIGGVKWSKYPNLNDNSLSKYYYGLYFGSAGTASFFLNLYKQTSNSSYLNIAKLSADYIYRGGIQNGTRYDRNFDKSGYIYWERSEDSGSAYSGMKYGNAGIATYFLELYEQTDNDTYLKWAEQSLRSLMAKVKIQNDTEKVDKGYSWGYALSGNTPITDIMYGVAGISSSLLKAYKINSNLTYLEFATNGLQWIISQSGINKNTTDGERFVRYSPDESYPYLFSGYLTGNSGIGEIFLDYYLVSKNEDYLLFAVQIGNWLVRTENNGFWEYGGADLLTGNYNNEGSYLGFGAGSAGIGLFLLQLYDYTKNEEYLKAIKRIDFMFQEKVFIEDTGRYWKIQDQGTLNDAISLDLKQGISGIGLFYNRLYHYFGLNESLVNLQGINNYIKIIEEEFGYIPSVVDKNIDSNTNDDLSYFDGLTGIATFYLDTINSLGNGSLYNDYTYLTLPVVDIYQIIGMITLIGVPSIGILVYLIGKRKN